MTATVAAANPVPTLAPSPVEPTVLPTALPISTVTVIPQAGAAQSSEQRWRAQQVQREVFDPPRIYVAHSRVPLLWYDPATGQSLEIGTLLGEFPVQAQFVLRDTGQVALEVPYRINVDFGLTAISEAVRSRMVAAGYAESVEAYIVHADVIQPK